MLRNRRKFLFTTMLIALVSSFYVSIIPNVHATELTTQQKSLSILGNVVGLDTSKYNVSSRLYPNDLYRDVLPRESVRSTLNSTGSAIEAFCTFINGHLQMINVFSNEGSPHMIAPKVSLVGMAQDFLSNYQTQSQNSFYGELNSMLAKVDADKNFTATVGNTKLTVTTSTNDTLFKWTYTLNGIDAPDKCVALRYKNGFLKYFVDNWNLYKIGSTSVNLSEQEAIEIAMARAKDYSSDAGFGNGTIGGIKFNVTNAMVIETLFAPSLYVDAEKAHSRDLFALYPMRHVWVSLDKFYPGNVYGFNVYVWADTKDICYFNERVSTVDPPPELVASVDNTLGPLDNQKSTFTRVKLDLSSLWLVLPMFAIAAILISPVYLRRKRASPHLGFPKFRCVKVSGVLLCLLVVSPLLAIATSASLVEATPYKGAATVWGAESIGSINTQLDPDESWRKSHDEVVWQQNTVAYIADLFGDNGYFSVNNQGAHNYGSSKGAILSQIDSLETTYPRVAVVDFDHGNGKNETDISGAPENEFHYFFEDNWGTKEGPTWPGNSSHANEHAVFDHDIYEETSGKTFFAFINTCNSAHVNATFYDDDLVSTQGLVGGARARGMPFAWSHGLKVTGSPDSTPPSGWISSNGYTDADSGDFCFIGFDFGSAALDQTVENTDYQYYYWVYHFFYYALTEDNTVNEALDLASHDTFYGSPDFDESPLFNDDGFTSIWRMFINGSWQNQWLGFPYVVANCHMKVYGNGEIKLYQPQLTVSAYDNNNNQVWPTFYIDGNSQGTGSLRVVPGSHTIDVDNWLGYSFDHFRFDYGSSSADFYYHPVTQEIPSDCILTAYYTQAFTDNFNDNSMDTSKWQKLQVNEATASETTGKLAVTVPSGGESWAQAGYVTKYAYNVNDYKATITVSELDNLDEMILQICTTKTTNTDPIYQNSWYRILKAKYDTKVYVQSKINGGDVSNKLVTDWTSATGELTIDISDGSIAFYENGNLRYSESCDLPSYDCYIYAFTSTLRSRTNGTDKFDNFEFSPTTYYGTATFGNTDIEASNGGGGGYVFGTKATLSEDGTVTRLSFYSGKVDATQKWKLAIYDHDAVNNKPNNLKVASTEQTGIVAGWNNVTVSVSLPSGTYWIIMMHNGGGTEFFCRYGTKTGWRSCYRFYTYGNFPDPFGAAGGFYTDLAYSMYGTYT